ncbi:hypothetical protein VCCP10303_3019, partial [Vibrio cholerae CP1030(3)]
MVAAGDKKP